MANVDIPRPNFEICFHYLQQLATMVSNGFETALLSSKIYVVDNNLIGRVAEVTPFRYFLT